MRTRVACKHPIHEAPETTPGFRLDEEKLAYDKRINAVGELQLDVRIKRHVYPWFPNKGGFFQIGARADYDIAGIVVQQQVSANHRQKIIYRFRLCSYEDGIGYVN